MNDFFDRLEGQLAAAAAEPRAARRTRLRPSPGALLVAASSLAVVAIVLGLLLALHGRPRTAPAARPPTPQSYVDQAIATVARRDPACNDDLVEGQTSQGSPPALASMLAVLRRPQTSRDLAYPPAMRALLAHAPRPRTLLDNAENWGTVYVNEIRRLPDAGGQATYLIPIVHGVRTRAPQRCVEAQGRALGRMLPTIPQQIGQATVDAARRTFHVVERRVIDPIEVLALMQVPLQPRRGPFGPAFTSGGTCCGSAAHFGPGHGASIGRPGYVVTVVPDTVATVAETWPAHADRGAVTYSARATDNTAVLRKPIPDYGPYTSIVWRSATGAVVGKYSLASPRRRRRRG